MYDDDVALTGNNTSPTTSLNASPEKHKPEPPSDENSIYCGLGPCRPKGMQVCVNMGCFAVAYSASGLVTSTLTIYINSQITTLEKQFGFSSSVSGLLMSCNDIGFLLTTLFMAYAARRVHIPRFLAASTLFYGFSGLICTIPYFITKDQLHPVTNLTMTSPITFDASQLCVNNFSASDTSLQDKCSQESGPQSVASITEGTRKLAIALIGIGMVCQGFGKSPRFPFLATFIDDNVQKTKTSMYIGVIMGMSVFGPAVAFVLGGFFSRIYVTLENVSMTPRDPQWIGAWWLGFLLFGGCGIVIGLPLMFFPRRMKPRDREIVEEKRRTKTALREAKKMSQSLLRLITNPIYMCLILSNCTHMLAVSGLLSFLPKYLEVQFLMPAWKANMLLGGVNVMASCVGTMIGGFITSKRQLKPLQCLKLSIVLNVISVTIASAGFFIGCPQPTINIGTVTATSDNTKMTSCSKSCGCESKNYFPVCGQNGVEYFSPCHAGCSSLDMFGFSNCSCVATDLMSAKPGLCETKCMMLYPYIAVSMVGAFLSTLTLMPSLICTLRSVPEIDKPLAIGLSTFLNTLLGWFPGPVLFGLIVDTTCLIWSKTCAGTGACLLYDMLLLRSRYHIIFLGARTASVVIHVVALIIATRKKKPFYDVNEDVVTSEEDILVNGDEKEMTIINTY